MEHSERMGATMRIVFNVSGEYASTTSRHLEVARPTIDHHSLATSPRIHSKFSPLSPPLLQNTKSHSIRNLHRPTGAQKIILAVLFLSPARFSSLSRFATSSAVLAASETSCEMVSRCVVSDRRALFGGRIFRGERIPRFTVYLLGTWR
jgi:hypothetical protein